MLQRLLQALVITKNKTKCLGTDRILYYFYFAKRSYSRRTYGRSLSEKKKKKRVNKNSGGKKK